MTSIIQLNTTDIINEETTPTAKGQIKKLNLKLHRIFNMPTYTVHQDSPCPISNYHTAY